MLVLAEAMTANLPALVAHLKTVRFEVLQHFKAKDAFYPALDYNCFLQKSIVDQSALFDAKRLLADAATEVVYSELSALKAAGDTAEVLFGQLGFGVLDAKAVTAQGGKATVKGSHYALGWLSKFVKASEPVCYFVAGFVEAAARQKFGSAFHVKETEAGPHCLPRWAWSK